MTPSTSLRAIARRCLHLCVATLLCLAASAACKRGEQENATTVLPQASPNSGGAPGVASLAPNDVGVTHDPIQLPLPPATWTGSSIGRSPDGEVLYVADEVHAQLHRMTLPLAEDSPFDSLPLPGPPAQVVVTHDRIFATIRNPALLWVGERLTKESVPPNPGESPSLARELYTIALPEDSFGLALATNERAVVTGAWSGTVSYVDLTDQRVLWSVTVPREPRGVVVTDDAKVALVTHLVGNSVTKVPLVDEPEPLPRSVNLPAAPLRSPGEPLPASLGYAGALSPDGGRYYVARHALGAVGKNAWFGAATVDVMTLSNERGVAPAKPVLPLSAKSDLAQQLISGGDTQVPGSGLTPFTQPRALVYRKSTQTLLIAGEGDDRVAELDALALDPTMAVMALYPVGTDYHPTYHVAKQGAAPSGLVLSSDEQRAWVYCAATNDVVEVALDTHVASPQLPENSSPPAALPVGVVATRHLLDDPLGPGGATGRKLFFSATDFPVSGGLGCAGCHPEGRDDGHVWHEATFTTEDGTRTNFVGHAANIPAEAHSRGFARRTVMLAGRVYAQGPYGWHGESPSAQARVQQGFGLHRWGAAPETPANEQNKRASALVDFIRRGLVAPTKASGPLTAVEQRGKEVFESTRAGCVVCHPPKGGLTTRRPYRLPPLPVSSTFDPDPETRYKIPDLLYLAHRAPYFHDGSAATLAELVEKNEYRMGNTAALSPEDRVALVAYLETL